jgi:hypothetical protein
MYLAEWPAFEIGAEEWTPQHNKVKQRAREQREACIAKTAPNFIKIFIHIHSR